jgi:hypothetical protein
MKEDSIYLHNKTKWHISILVKNSSHLIKKNALAYCHTYIGKPAHKRRDREKKMKERRLMM